MQYSLLFYMHPEDFAVRRDPEKNKAFWASFMPYMTALREAGIVVAGAGLQAPETAATVRLNGGEPVVHDGPYADTKEQLGGFFVIDVPDMETAVAWARRYPIRGAAEVRPNLPPAP